MVIHWTVEVETPNSFIRAGKAMFMAVSTTTPAKDMMPTATTARTRRASSLRSKVGTKLIV